jgi:hypothetical protein
MERTLIFFTMVAALGLTGCTRARNQSSAESTSDLTQAIGAVRAAYAAFNRGDIEAAVEPLDAAANQSGLSFPATGLWYLFTQSFDSRAAMNGAM